MSGSDRVRCSSGGEDVIYETSDVSPFDCFRRFHSKSTASVQTPTTPVTPATPILAAHFYDGENVMEDLHLAAELGKTLLERNRDLESTIKHQQAIIDDQAQEIEYFNKQTAALREVNDSRLRVYEQLEISIQDLENANQRLVSEGTADKKKIRSLNGTIEHLEGRNEELQKNYDDLKSQQQQRGRTQKRRSFIADEQAAARRCQSCENSTHISESVKTDNEELKNELEGLQKALKEIDRLYSKEVTRREELEEEIAEILKENSTLAGKLTDFKERLEFGSRSLDDEIASVDNTSSSRVCKKCMACVDDAESNLTMQDFTDDFEDYEAPTEAINGNCALFKLKNGGYAWGSQESLASMGQVVSCVNSTRNSSPNTDGNDVPHTSVFSELDAKYRTFYESLLVTKSQHNKYEPLDHGTVVNPGVDNVSGPMSLVLTNGPPAVVQNTIETSECAGCTPYSGDLKPHDNSRPKSIQEELSEVETTSSGFSDGESRLYSRATQTEDDNTENDSTFGTQMAPLDLMSPVNPVENRFQSTPEYRKIFNEIFTVLKQTVGDHNSVGEISEKILDSLKSSVEDLRSGASSRMDSVESMEIKSKYEEINTAIEETKPQIIIDKKKSEKSKKSPRKTPQKDQKNSQNLSDKENEISQPKRPNSLEIESFSRSSSRQSRRRRKQKQTPLPTNSNIVKVDSQMKSVQQPEPVFKRPLTPPSLNISVTNSKLHCQSKQKPKVNIGEYCQHKQKKRKAKTLGRSNGPLQERQKTPNYNPSSFWIQPNIQPIISQPLADIAKLKMIERSYAEALKSVPNKQTHFQKKF